MKLPTPLLLAGALFAASSAFCAESAPASDDTGREARMKWFEEARFGMFIHWSPSSVNGTEIGWGRRAKRPMEAPGNGGGPAGTSVDPVYDNLYKRFNPTGYDAKAWVKLAGDAGMQYMVFTTKHHEGFSMWPTKARPEFSIAAAPYKDGKGDVLRDLADAAHASGMRLGWYYSPRDWTHPDYGVGDNAKYEEFMHRQLREIFTDYGKIDLVWWDSFGVGDSFKFWHADKTLELVKSLQPDIVTNNRCSFYVETNRKGLEGDFDTPEQVVGKYQVDRPWESCITLVGHNWGYNPHGAMMNVDRVIATLVSCATGGGNLLLNTGPMPDGRIEPRQAELLREVGAWMKKYGESIYATKGGPFRNGRWGGVTFRDKDVYLHILPSAQDSITFPKLDQNLTGFTCLTGGSVEVVQKDGVVHVKVPRASRATPDTIVKLTFDRPVTRVSGEVAIRESALDGLADIGREASYTVSSELAGQNAEKDRLFTGGAKGEFAFHTLNEKNPFVVIDLKSVRRVEAVAIENRAGYEERAKNLVLSASEDGKTWTRVWAAEKGETRWVAIPEAMVSGASVKGVDARYLRLETNNDTPTALHLRAVTIYGR